VKTTHETWFGFGPERCNRCGKRFDVITSFAGAGSENSPCGCYFPSALVGRSTGDEGAKQ
jgi:hypothetical protein